MVAMGTLTSWAQDGAIEPLASPPALHGAGADTAAPGAGAVLLTASPTAARPSTLPAAKCSREDGGHPPRAASVLTCASPTCQGQATSTISAEG